MAIDIYKNPTGVDNSVIPEITTKGRRPEITIKGPAFPSSRIGPFPQSLADGADDRMSPDDRLATLQEALDIQSKAERAKREAQITAMGGDFDTNVAKYQERLSPYMYQAPKMSFFDLASELGAGLLSTPNTGGASAYQGLGVGFTRASERMRVAEEENRKSMQQIGLQAAQLAMQDEQKAEDFLNQIAIQRLKDANDPKDHLYIEGVATEETNRILGREETIGSPSFVSLRDSQTNRGAIDALTGSGWVIKKDPSSVVNIDQTTETTADKEGAKAQYDFQTKILEESMAASSTRDTITVARENARKLTEDGLYPERFGLVPQITNPIRNLMAGLDLGIVDMDRLAGEDLGNQLGVGFAMATVALTKGAISNREMEMFLQAAPTMGRTYAGYLEMLDYMDRIANRTEEFAEAYMVEKRRIEDAATEAGVKRSASQVKDDLDLFAIKWKKDNSLFNEDEKQSLIERADVENYKRVEKWYKGGEEGPVPNSNAPNVINSTKPELEVQRDKIIRKIKNKEYEDDEMDAAKELLADINRQIASL